MDNHAEDDLEESKRVSGQGLAAPVVRIRRKLFDERNGTVAERDCSSSNLQR